ncbi:MAG: iron-sulfur cluster-binding protein [Armatimonadetes bacterium CG07_land_8_20_14_0_80_40_9]|nr:MAG: iron-sulfur cluster-binding protein [Armatimonadetes bacterium CG07_land_8_20_14_0_80_40_9]
MAVVAVLKTNPKTVVDDYRKLLHLSSYQDYLPREKETILKINISWHFYFPACSTTPWQFEGVVKTMLSEGYKNLIPAQNRTVVVDPKKGAVNNHLTSVLRKYGLKFIYLYEKGVKWTKFKPKSPLLVLDKIFPEGILIPELFIGKSALHLPTLKTHVFTKMTGAMKNAFGGLLRDNRHWCHSQIDEALVDLLTIQKEIHPGLFAVMDGTIAGSGPGPRVMVPEIKNFILASADQVAIDAVAAKMMGFEPLSLPFIRMAHDRGLGCGDLSKIEIKGEDIKGVNFNFKVGDTFASRGQKAIYHGFLKPLENSLLRSPLVPWSYLASRLYHDLYWYPFIGKGRVKKILKTEWGKLFESYS